MQSLMIKQLTLMTTSPKEQGLEEYDILLQEIVEEDSFIPSKGYNFVQAVLLAIQIQPDPTARNNYIKTMGKTFGIDSNKVERLTQLLP